MRSTLMFFLVLTCSVSADAQTPQVVRSTGPGAWGTVRLIEDKRIGVIDGASGLVRDHLLSMASNGEEEASSFDWATPSARASR